MENEEVVYKGIFYEGDIYEQIKSEIGLDIKNNPNYRIGFTGAADDLGISETLYSEFYVFRKKEKITPNPTGEDPVIGEDPKVTPNPKGEDPKVTPNPKGEDPVIGEDPKVTPNPTGEDPVIGKDPKITPNPTGEDPVIEIGDIPQKIKEFIETDEEESKFIRVVRKYKNQALKWLVMLAIMLMLLTGFKTENIKKYGIEKIEKTSIGYTITLTDEQQVDITNEELQILIGKMGIGSDINLKNDDVLYFDSLLKDPTSTIGKSIRKEGTYKITGISIVYGDKIIEYEVDLGLENPGLTIEDYVKQVCDKHGLDAKNINVRIHVGSSVDNTITGWIDATKLLQIDYIDQTLIDEISSKSATYDGNIENFTDSKIVIQTENSDVTIPVKDATGNFYQPGTKVIGSDGNEYLIQELNVTNETIDQQKEIDGGKKLTWKIQNCNLALGMLPLVAALATELAVRKKNAEAQKNPKFYEFDNEKEYIKFKKDFEKRKEEYEKSSNFVKMLKNIFWRKEVDLLQELTEEQIKQIYSEIRNFHTGDYSYNPSDKINFVNGKIIVTFKDGKKMDITDIILPKIAHIGKENPIVTEGLLPDEERKTGKK